jgi:hypothetical protein
MYNKSLESNPSAMMEDQRTIGTSYYYSSLNYLGYSPYSEPCYGGLYETKPFAYPNLVSLKNSIPVQLLFSANLFLRPSAYLHDLASLSRAGDPIGPTRSRFLKTFFIVSTPSSHFQITLE